MPKFSLALGWMDHCEKRLSWAVNLRRSWKKFLHCHFPRDNHSNYDIDCAKKCYKVNIYMKHKNIIYQQQPDGLWLHSTSCCFLFLAEAVTGPCMTRSRSRPSKEALFTGEPNNRTPMDTGHEALVSCCFLRTIAVIFTRYISISCITAGGSKILGSLSLKSDNQSNPNQPWNECTKK